MTPSSATNLPFESSAQPRIPRPVPVGFRSRYVLFLAPILMGLFAGCAAFSKNRVDEGIVSARQLSLQGVDAMRRGRYEEAQSMLSQAITVCPLDEQMHSHYADTLWAMGDQDAAVRHMEQAVKLSGNHAELAVRLGDMYLARGDLDSAAIQAERAISSNRQLASAWALRGDVLGQRDSISESLASYHRALALQEHYPRVQFSVAQTYRQQGRPLRALATLRSLVDGYPADEVPRDVLLAKGQVLKDMQRYSAAVESLLAASRTGPPSVDLLYQLADAQTLAGDHVNARLTIESALAISPEHAPSRELNAHLANVQRRLAADLKL